MKSHQLVYQILARENDYVSGEKIGEELNLSRTSIWKAIQRLQQEGLEIDSIKNRGYKLIQGDLILPDLIQEKTNLTIRYKPETKSTQTDAKEGIEAGNKGNTLYLSTCQTAGRGRFQRPYYSPSQGGIYMSLHIQPNLPYEKLPSYTLLVAAAVYKAIKNLTMIEVDIKWVNDIYFKNKKSGPAPVKVGHRQTPIHEKARTLYGLFFRLYVSCHLFISSTAYFFLVELDRIKALTSIDLLTFLSLLPVLPAVIGSYRPFSSSCEK